MNFEETELSLGLPGGPRVPISSRKRKFSRGVDLTLGCSSSGQDETELSSGLPGGHPGGVDLTPTQGCSSSGQDETSDSTSIPPAKVKFPAQEMEMASTCIDRVLLDLELLKKRHLYSCIGVAIKATEFLKAFLMCARKWNQSNDMYLASYIVPKLASLPSTLSNIERVIHSFLLRSETDANFFKDHYYLVFSTLTKLIKSFNGVVLKVYFILARSWSFQSNSRMTDDELMEFIDVILENLADLSFWLGSVYEFECQTFRFSDCATLNAQVKALEEKLTFLKSFIPFVKLRGTVDIPPLLLAHSEVVALSAARLSHMCFMWFDAEKGHDPEIWVDAEKWHNPNFYSMICVEQQKINPVDSQVYEIYMEVLRATRSSKSLDSPTMDKQILENFNDSLISCLWELLCCSSSFMDSMKDEMQRLYAGLRFLRSILRQHQEKMDEQNERIGALLSEAGIIICSPSLNRVKEGKVSFLESTEAPDCYDMLAETNKHIKHFEDQISVSSMIESFPSSLSLTVQAAGKPSSHMVSKGKIPIIHEVMVGLDDEAEKVINRLISGPQHLEIVPIVGMAGLGKTTLAKKVYNDSSVVHSFHIRLWCTVSQEFNMKSWLTQTLCSDGKHSKKKEENKKAEGDEHALLQELYQKLKGNQYLVVFDDVWDLKAWNKLRCSFPDENNNSRILFTSRFSNVAASEVLYGGKPHNLRPLNEEESFELLQKKVFGKEDCPETLCGFAKEIAKKCRGLPLAVIVVAGVLAAIEHDILVWEEFAKCLTLTMVSGTDECKKSLELSYGYLPYHLKACLLYFAAFQEDEKIGAKRLMRLWSAEGFVEEIEGRRSEDIAEEYLMDLIGRNLVMVSESRSIGGVKTCYIHDLIFEFCKAKAKAKNFLQVLRGYDELSTFNEPPNLPRLSICSSAEEVIESKLFCPHLSSLLLFDYPDRRSFDTPILNISFLFCIYKHLKVLNLEGVVLELEELPTEVESLLCLRYLALTALKMEVIPPSIAKLSNLETFCLNSGESVTLPDSIWNMKKLRHVHVRSWFYDYGILIAFPFSSDDDVVENLPTLPNLETLSVLGLDLDQKEDNMLRRIRNVRQLKICLFYEDRKCCNMSGLECLESLTLYRADAYFESKDFFQENCIELSFPVSLKKLSLDGVGPPLSKMSLIEELPNLEVLILASESLDGQRWELMEGGFPKLRVLILSDLDIVEWTETDPDCGDYLPCLQKLKLYRIYQLEMLPSCLGLSPTLETIELKYCRDATKSSVREIEESQREFRNDELTVIYE